ncbi:diacylglycerol/lipid kinase family protein [Embleya hyalina]|uniref:Diacylglycerol kinase n=1 Tax=Embleya hyalina TaxID=516124 RepID=A0A401Z1G7_9ACTN|nr:diacylglycerol kinase family protein [Embleya hyalina]GCE00730.1 diacylglycerol kinase [Embleya hyalina]
MTDAEKPYRGPRTGRDRGDPRTEATTPEARPLPVTAAQRRFARLAFAAALATAAMLVVGGRTSLFVLIVGVLGLVVTLAALWGFLSRRGPLRWACAIVTVAVPITVIAVYIARGHLWDIVLTLLLAALAVAAARAALVLARPPAGMPERETPPPARPFLIMNPRSGGGKVGRFALDDKAAARGAEVALLTGPGPVDVAALARRAVADGADLLGVAGGDGTQALVAGIAAENDLPFLVVSAGTRNHFAMDLGLDRERPDAGLDALDDGVELCLDLGLIGGRTFVNNASFGAYAEVVRSPEYRDDKRGTMLRLLPEMLSGRRGPHLVVRIDDDVVVEAPKALLVSNNPYEFGGPAEPGRRSRLDTGLLGVVAITVDNAEQAVELLRGRRGRGLRTLVAHEVLVESDAPQIPVGIDGEAVLMPTPVRLTIRPLALRVRVPRERPGVPRPKPVFDLALLRRQALTMARLAGGGTSPTGRRRRS